MWSLPAAVRRLSAGRCGCRRGRCGLAPNGLTIDRLHVTTHGRRAPDAAGTAALRVALEQALRQVRNTNLPPQAVLVIRTLASRAALGAGGGAGLRWRQELEGQFADLARQALRPDRQHVPPDANCVLFDDEVTLLACLTRDVLAGHWTWYWDELFPRTAQAALLRLGESWRPYSQLASAGSLAGLSSSRTSHLGCPAACRGGCRPEPFKLGRAVAAGPQPACYLCPPARRIGCCRFRIRRLGTHTPRRTRRPMAGMAAATPAARPCAAG